MEKELEIKTPDRKYINGALGFSKKKTSKLVIFVHGFTGHANEHIFFNGSKFLTTNGFDTFRFDLYAGGKKRHRHFKDVSISLHGKDINSVVDYFRKKYKEIIVVGHSYGGVSLLFTDQSKIDGFIFWDASYISSKDAREDMFFNKKMNRYVLDWGIEILVGNRFVKELKNFKDCGELAGRITKPVLFITAGKGNSKDGIKYFKYANRPKKLINIKTADHNFNSWESEEELIRHTYNWLRQF